MKAKNSSNSGQKTVKTPLRKCLGCTELKPKKELIRVVLSENNEVSIDKTSKKNGRGAYICSNEECLTKAFKSRGIERSFKMNISKEIYETLKSELNKNDG